MARTRVTVQQGGFFADPREEWLELHHEEVIDPVRPIVDAHHHLWDRAGRRYLIQEFAADIASGHNIVATVYVDCHSMYRKQGPEPLRPVGEVEFANGVAAMSASGGYGSAEICAGIVGHADLLRGDGVQSVLEAEVAAGNGRFRGIRHLSAWDADPDIAGGLSKRSAGLLLDGTFRKGFSCLEPMGLTFDAFLFHTQIGELVELAQSFPSTEIVLNHCGGPVAIGRYGERPDEAFAEWKTSIRELAECSNVSMKLGGLAVRLLGTDFEDQPMPPSSRDTAAAWAPYIETCIEYFGADRCMFESNFPPDKGQCSYQVLFNTFKRITAGCGEDEKTALFSKTAADFYRLDLG